MKWNNFFNNFKWRLKRFFSNGDPDFPTKLLISANISVFLAWKVVPGFMYNHFVMNEVNTLKNHKYYTILTSAFSEREFMPLLFNSITIWFFGRPITYMIGAGGLFTLYFSGAMSNFLGLYYKYKHQYYKGNLPNSSGAQASIAAVLAYFIIKNPWEPILLFIIPVPAVLVGMLMIYLGSNGRDNTSLYGGLGGAAIYMLRFLKR